MQKIRKGDTVQIMRGKDAGKRAEVEIYMRDVIRNGKKRDMVIVKGVNLVKKHTKPNPQFGIKGGLNVFEKPIDVSNVMLIDPKSNTPTRVGFKFDENGKKIRISKKSGETI